jgi:feruloyl-CoA synthase
VRAGAMSDHGCVELVRRGHGVLDLRSTREPTEPPASSAHWLAHWAEQTPDALLLSEEAGGGGARRQHAYGSVWASIVAEAHALASAGVGPGDRVAVIAANGFAHFVTGHAAMLAGAVYAPIATQYLGPGADPDRLRGVLALLEPSLILCEPGADRAGLPAGALVTTEPLSAGSDSAGGQEPDAGRALLARVEPDAAAKLLLTSGSTGRPKAVVYTHRMLTANAAATADVWPFVRAHKPVLVDWLPWNHAFGGNANLNMVLIGGGSLHVDGAGGRPGTLERSIELITRLQPTFYAAVPAGFQALLPGLEDDLAFRSALLGPSMDALFSAGASMPASTFHRLRTLSKTVREEAVPILSGWGSTEVGPGATIAPPGDSRPGQVGPPLPGVTVRLVPTGDKYELRVKGPSVMGGYWREPKLSAAVFDEDGFFCSGDAGRLVDELDPALGLLFDGRLADDFKLSNGSWVNVDRLRRSLLALAGPRVRDVVIAGPDRPHLVAVFWLGPDVDEPFDVAGILERHNAANAGQTNRILAGEVVRCELDPELITSKGTIKPRQYREARVGEIEAIYTGARSSAAVAGS